MEKVNILDIVDNGMCTGCGLCISESDGALEMKWNQFGFITPHLVPHATVPLRATRVCPFNPTPEHAVRDEDQLAAQFLNGSPFQHPRVGNYYDTYIGYSKEFRLTSSSGGIATFVFAQLLKEKDVDALYIVKEKNGSYEYQWFNNSDEITLVSKTRYIPVTMAELFNKIEQFEGKIAISGVACFIKAIRLKQHYQPQLKEKIPFLVGIICGGWKSHFFSDYLAQNSGIRDSYTNAQFRIKDPNSLSSDYYFGANDSKGDFHTLRMRDVGDMWGTGLFKSKACDFCTDVLTELSDISLGDAWLPEYSKDGLGTSIIITRSKRADELIRGGIEMGDLILNTASIDQIMTSQRASFEHRQNAVGYRIELEKKTNNRCIPHVRERLICKIPWIYRFVQRQRMRIRKNSLEFWRDTKTLSGFEKKISRDLNELKRRNRLRFYISRLSQKINSIKIAIK